LRQAEVLLKLIYEMGNLGFGIITPQTIETPEDTMVLFSLQMSSKCG
jgi:hypothetical protein